MSIEYLDLVDYIAIAAEVTRLKVETIVGLPNLPLADSALQEAIAGTICLQTSRALLWWWA